MKESILHYLWKFKKLSSLTFTSVDQQHIRIINPGTHNTNAGPDFLNAKIQLNGVEMYGHIEIHVRSSEWEKHQHQFDEAYNNVILHIVYECDQAVFTHSGFELIQAEIKNLVNEKDIQSALMFIESKKDLVCGKQLSTIPAIVVQKQIELAFISRLERKSGEILQDLNFYNNDWEQTTYSAIARAFGSNINKYPFERLSKIIPWKNLIRESYNLNKTEATLFHYSGLIESDSEYAQQIKQIKHQLNLKYNQEPLKKSEWKFSTMHPGNFPTLRISQFADLYFQQKNLFSRITEAQSIDDFNSIFTCKASDYWNNRYTFENTSNLIQEKKLSKTMIQSIIINAAIPIYFTWHRQQGNSDTVEKCIDFMEKIPSEKNIITQLFLNNGIHSQTAFDSQALIELKNNFCDQKKCLTCGIGFKLLNP